MSILLSIRDRILSAASDAPRQPCAASLHKVLTGRRQVPGRRMTQLSPRRMREVCGALAFAVRCDVRPA